MTQRTLSSLIAVNIMLLALLMLVTLTPAPATAQFGAAGNKYLMLAGVSPQRSQQAVIYIIDVNTSNMMALMVNTSNNTVELIAGHRIADDLRPAAGTAQPGRGR